MGLKRYFRKKRLWKRVKYAFDEVMYELINEVIEDLKEFDLVYGTNKLYKYLERMIRKSKYDDDRNELNPTIIRLLPSNPQLVRKIHDATDYQAEFVQQDEEVLSNRQLEDVAEKRQKILDRKEFVRYSMRNERKNIGKMG